MTIWLKTCFWTWKSRKWKKQRALTFVKFFKIATGGHFQDSKFMISLKHPGPSLVSFYAAGPFVAFSQYMYIQVYPQALTVCKINWLNISISVSFHPEHCCQKTYFDKRFRATNDFDSKKIFGTKSTKKSDTQNWDIFS